MNKKTNQTSTTSEKPVSLSPLKFVKALKGLLSVKPKPKAEKTEEKIEEKEKEKPGS